MSTIRTPYPSEVGEEEWSHRPRRIWALLPEDVGQRTHDLCEVWERLALSGEGRHPLAHVAARVAALAGSLPAAAPVAGLHSLAFACLMLHQLTGLTLRL